MEDAAGLKSAYEKRTKEFHELRERLKVFGDLAPETARALAAQVSG